MRIKKNFTLCWMILLGAILTTPIAVVILKNYNGTNFYKTLLITAVFFVITGTITFLFKRIFGVSMEEITQETRVTELDKKLYWLRAYTSKHRITSNYMQLMIKDTSKIITQIENFNRRKLVYLKILEEEREETDSLIDLVNDVEKALDFNVDKIIDRLNIFDDRVQKSIIEDNLRFIELYMDKNDTLLLNFERLITEVSRLGDTGKEKDITELTDIIKAMQSLRMDKNEEIDDLMNKYQ